ncbi:uncharacterized protein C8Q71DRAFT_597521 [Rhodofomes roseus]|uniref:Uncharacterized protein n=1 Tax=Rhodofomes roseus TaxID=34475 RepID=A0ABQ8KHX5_9APHY|nr:uncharacterized protein C8Q71DRAFT_597521 [Rhodofomes roseus]KAH9837345.1 hypothetical protein C8Q71DRAFT_597521 [Rhodofomes roseus]
MTSTDMGACVSEISSRRYSTHQQSQRNTRFDTRLHKGDERCLTANTYIHTCIQSIIHEPPASDSSRHIRYTAGTRAWYKMPAETVTDWRTQRSASETSSETYRGEHRPIHPRPTSSPQPATTQPDAAPSPVPLAPARPRPERSRPARWREGGLMRWEHQ